MGTAAEVAEVAVVAMTTGWDEALFLFEALFKDEVKVEVGLLAVVAAGGRVEEEDEVGGRDEEEDEVWGSEKTMPPRTGLAKESISLLGSKKEEMEEVVEALLWDIKASWSWGRRVRAAVFYLRVLIKIRVYLLDTKWE